MAIVIFFLINAAAGGIAALFGYDKEWPLRVSGPWTIATIIASIYLARRYRAAHPEYVSLWDRWQNSRSNACRRCGKEIPCGCPPLPPRCPMCGNTGRYYSGGMPFDCCGGPWRNRGR